MEEERTSSAHPVARHSDVIDADAPASSLAALDPSRGTLCGGVDTSCMSRLRVLRRISAGGREGGERGAGEHGCPKGETYDANLSRRMDCGMMLTFRRTRHVLGAITSSEER